MSLDPELEAWLTLSLARGLNHHAYAKLLIAFGNPQQVLAASHKALSAVVSAELAGAIAEPRPDDVLQTIEKWLADPANKVLTLADEAYPRVFLQMPDPPPVLYTKGRTELLNHPAFAIVGSRNATKQGAAHAEAFGRVLSDAGLTIVSGLALGIDAAAHRGGLAGASSSIAVVGTGLDTVYPAKNRDLAHELARDGLIVSEFALGTPPVATNFPRRNRLISGLANGCLVVEAAVSSGSLITARLANEQGKDVFAMPGSVNSPLSKGCHRLIKDGAKLVESAEDILEELKLPGAADKRPKARVKVHMDTDARRLFDELGFDPCDIDTLAQRTGATAQILSALLMQWEIEGLVESLPGGRYQRLES